MYLDYITVLLSAVENTCTSYKIHDISNNMYNIQQHQTVTCNHPHPVIYEE